MPHIAVQCQALRPATIVFDPFEETAFAAAANPSRSASLKKFSIGIYNERRYLINGLDNYLLCGGMPLNNGGLAFSIKRFSAGAFKQSEAGLAYAKKLGQVDVGAQFNYHSLSIDGYGKASVIVADVGTLWRVTEQLQIIAGIYNISGARLNKLNEKLAYETRCAFGYKVSTQLFLLLQIAKQESKPVNVQAGLQYSPADAIIIYAGVESMQPYGAFSWRWNKFRVMMSVRFHQQLGLTPGLGLLYLNNEQ